jgi:hypothetical protein
MVYYTKYVISTITNNIDVVADGIKTKVNLNILFDEISISDPDKVGFVWTQCQRHCERIIRGIIPKKKRNSGNRKRIFDNQTSFVFRMTDEYYPNVKVFQNGNIQMTGAKTLDDIWLPLNTMYDELLRIYQINPDILPDVKDISKLRIANLQIRMINTDFKLYKDDTMTQKFSVKRKELHRILTNEYDVISRYDPFTYPGVKTEYWWNKYSDQRNGNDFMDKRGVKGCDTSIFKKITIAVFESGSILITGAVNIVQVDDAYKFITDVIKKHENSICVGIIN